MTEQQAVATATDGQTQAVTEGAGAQDDLDALLKEFETQDQTTKSETTTETKPDDLQEVVAYVRNQQQSEILEQSRKDLSEAARIVKGDLKIDDEIAEGYLHARANKDPRVAQAWAKRHENPSAYQKVLKSLGGDFAKKFADLPDQAATEDRAAVAAAVRGASTRTQEPAIDTKQLQGMNDAQFAAFKRSLG